MNGFDATRGRLAAYFDGTANEAWRRLMSDAPVSRIRETVRAGRSEMRAALLTHLPEDLSGARVLDAGCGSGQMSRELAARGACVVAIDISPRLLEMARETTPAALAARIDYRAGDMLDPAIGRLTHVVAMDSLIHYRIPDAAAALAALAARTDERLVFTVAPRTALLSAMFAAGKCFPRSDRAPAIVPVGDRALSRALAGRLPEGRGLRRGTRVARGFYISQAMEIAR